MTATVVIEVAPEGTAHRWVVPSATIPGALWMVQLTPGKSLTCSCPHGRRIAAAGIRVPSPRPCHHLVAVRDLEAGRAAERTPTKAIEHFGAAWVDYVMAVAVAPCPTCNGQACDEGCGQCDTTPSAAGPDAHRQCRTCKGSGVAEAGEAGERRPA